VAQGKGCYEDQDAFPFIGEVQGHECGEEQLVIKCICADDVFPSPLEKKAKRIHSLVRLIDGGKLLPSFETKKSENACLD
jgi:hypothetical protein